MNQATLLSISALAFVIFFHEGGHWLAARLLGMQTPVFSIGFGGRNLSISLGKFWQTEFRLGLIPLGGYVILPEMLDGESRKEALKELNMASDSCREQPAWKKAIVAAAGPMANVVLAYLLYAFLLWYHRGMTPPMAVLYAFTTTYKATASIVTGLAMLMHLVPLDPALPAGATDLHSIVGIFQVVQSAAGTSLIYFTQVIAYLSINLAVLNLVPLPMLDGGQLTILAIEKVKGSPLNSSVRNLLIIYSLILIAGLTVLGLYNDFVHPFTG